MPNVLVINSGSSSIKFQLIAMPAEQRRLRGLLERIGGERSRLHIAWRAGRSVDRELSAPDHAAGLTAIFSELDLDGSVAGGRTPDDALDVIAHRVVHGGGDFTTAVRIDDTVIAGLDRVSELAPLHNAANLAGIRFAREHLPETSQVAVFDTAFHHDLPERARLYALPLALQRELRIRRYGFHGLSHRYVTRAAADWLQRPLRELKLISLHLGNGASACAVRGGRSIDTSMGFTPLEGLVMGSRSGDLDPALPGLIAEHKALSAEQVDELLNRRSGLYGLCGERDMRRVEQRMNDGDAEARLAFELFVYRIRKYVGAYVAALNGLDALIFTAGIGEHSAAVRAAVCREMQALGIAVDARRNAEVEDPIAEISPPEAARRVLVITTDEELEIARATHACLAGSA